MQLDAGDLSAGVEVREKQVFESLMVTSVTSPDMPVQSPLGSIIVSQSDNDNFKAVAQSRPDCPLSPFLRRGRYSRSPLMFIIDDVQVSTKNCQLEVLLLTL